MMPGLLLLLQAAAVVPAQPAPVDPLKTLKGTVIDAIRNCGEAPNGQIRVCSRDRGYAEERGDRLPKLVKPKVIANDPVVSVQVGATPTPPAR